MDYQDLMDIEKPEYEECQEGDDCPRCEDGKLTVRYARNENGNEFLGCTNYPRCEFTADLPDV